MDVFRNIADSLEPGGLFVFDSHDPTRGDYRQAVEQTRHALEELGYRKNDVDGSWLIVDGPPASPQRGTQREVYNRQILPRELLIHIGDIANLDLVSVTEVRATTGVDNWDLIFVFRKRTTPIPSYSTSAQTTI